MKFQNFCGWFGGSCAGLGGSLALGGEAGGGVGRLYKPTPAYRFFITCDHSAGGTPLFRLSPGFRHLVSPEILAASIMLIVTPFELR